MTKEITNASTALASVNSMVVIVPLEQQVCVRQDFFHELFDDLEWKLIRDGVRESGMGASAQRSGPEPRTMPNVKVPS